LDGGKVVGIDGGGLVNRIPDALLAEVLCLLEVDDLCSAARNDELGGAGNFTATDDEFDGAMPTRGLGLC
jgi:hypothetical protein